MNGFAYNVTDIVAVAQPEETAGENEEEEEEIAELLETAEPTEKTEAEDNTENIIPAEYTDEDDIADLPEDDTDELFKLFGE